MAGITRADPNYFINHQSKGFLERRLVVLEYVISGGGHISYNGITKKVSAGDFYLLNSEFSGSYRSDTHDPFVKKWININGQLVSSLLKAYGIKNQVLILHFDAEKYFDTIFDILSSYDEDDPQEYNRRLSHVLIDLFVDIRSFQEIQKRCFAPRA